MKLLLSPVKRLVLAFICAPAVVYIYGAAYVIVLLNTPDAVADGGHREKMISLLLFPTLPSAYLGAALFLSADFIIWRRCSSRIVSLVGIIGVLGMIAGVGFHIAAISAVSGKMWEVTTWGHALVVGLVLGIALIGVALVFAAIAFGPRKSFQRLEK